MTQVKNVYKVQKYGLALILVEYLLMINQSISLLCIIGTCLYMWLIKTINDQLKDRGYS